MSEDFTNQYIELTYGQVIHIGEESYLYDGTGSFIRPRISGSFYVDGGSIYVDGNVIGGPDDNVARTDVINYFTGSQNIQADHNRIESGDFTYTLDMSSVYTGSKRGMIGIRSDISYEPPEQVSESGYFPYLLGYSSTTDLNADITASWIIGAQQVVRAKTGYVENIYGHYIMIRSYEYAEKISAYLNKMRYDGHVEDYKGLLLEGVDNGGTIDNQYAIFISSSLYDVTGSNNSYAIYSEPNVPSYFGGQLHGSGSLVLDLSSNREVSSDWSYGTHKKTYYTGSVPGFYGENTYNSFQPTEQLYFNSGYYSGSEPVVIGSNHQLVHNNVFTSSALYSFQTNTVINNGYVDTLYGLISVTNHTINSYTKNSYAVSAIPLFGNKTSELVKNYYGYALFAASSTGYGIVENMYGLYVSESYFPVSASNKYAIYSEPNVPSYFGGQIQGSGSLIIDTSENRFDYPGDWSWTYGVYVKSLYTGSYYGFEGITNINVYDPDVQPSASLNRPYSSNLKGIYNEITHESSITGSYIWGSFDFVVSKATMTHFVKGRSTNLNIRGYTPWAYGDEVFFMNGGTGHTINQLGYSLSGVDQGGSVENIYGLYISSSYFPANITSQSYAIYSEPNVPSYFGGQIQGNSLYMETNTGNRYELANSSYAAVFYNGLYTGSKRNYTSITSDGTYSPLEQNSGSGLFPYVYGMSNFIKHDAPFTASVLLGYQSYTRNKQGYVDALYGYDAWIANEDYTVRMASFRSSTDYEAGHIENVYGFLLEGENNQSTIDNQYGIYVSSSYFNATGSNSYAIYSEPNVPSYFGGSIQVSGSVLLTGSYDTNTAILFGDGDSGFYEGSSNQVYLRAAGGDKIIFNELGVNLAWGSYRARMYNVNPSATVPTFVFNGDENTGIGRAEADTGSLIAGATNVLNWYPGNVDVNDSSINMEGILYEQQNSASLTLDDSGSVQQISIDKNMGTHNLYYKYNDSGSVIEVTSSFGSVEQVTQFTRDANDDIVSWEIINN